MKALKKKLASHRQQVGTSCFVIGSYLQSFIVSMVSLSLNNIFKTNEGTEIVQTPPPPKKGQSCDFFFWFVFSLQLKGIAIDPSQHACDLTKENAATYDVSDKLDVIHTEIDNKGNIKNLKPELLEKKFDLIVSNPPYIPSLDIPHLDSEVSL